LLFPFPFSLSSCWLCTRPCAGSKWRCTIKFYCPTSSVFVLLSRIFLFQGLIPVRYLSCLDPILPGLPLPFSPCLQSDHPPAWSPPRPPAPIAPISLGAFTSSLFRKCSPRIVTGRLVCYTFVFMPDSCFQEPSPSRRLRRLLVFLTLQFMFQSLTFFFSLPVGFPSHCWDPPGYVLSVYKLCSL